MLCHAQHSNVITCMIAFIARCITEGISHSHQWDHYTFSLHLPRYCPACQESMIPTFSETSDTVPGSASIVH